MIEGRKNSSSRRKRPTKKQKAEIKGSLACGSDSSAGVIYGVVRKWSVRLVNAAQKMEQKTKNPQEAR